MFRFVFHNFVKPGLCCFHPALEAAGATSEGLGVPRCLGVGDPLGGRWGAAPRIKASSWEGPFPSGPGQGGRRTSRWKKGRGGEGAFPG